MPSQTSSGSPLKLLAALAKVMAEVTPVRKEKENQFHGYKYAGEDDIIESVRPALIKHGVLVLPHLSSGPELDPHGNTHLVMEYTFYHVESGESLPAIRFPGTGNDRSKSGSIGDKGSYKALTGANKYFLTKVFQIATHDDPEKDGEEAPTGALNPGATMVPVQTQAPLNTAELTYGPRGPAQLTVPFKSPAQESHERVALGVQTVEAFLPLAKTALELDSYYIANKDTIEGHIKKVDPGAYKDLLEKFKKRKAELKT